MRNLLPLFLLLSIVACSGDPTADAAKLQAYDAAYRPLVNAEACRLQAAANAAAAVAAASGNAADSANAALASQALGFECYTVKPVPPVSASP